MLHSNTKLSISIFDWQCPYTIPTDRFIHHNIIQATSSINAAFTAGVSRADTKFSWQVDVPETVHEWYAMQYTWHVS